MLQKKDGKFDTLLLLYKRDSWSFIESTYDFQDIANLE